MIYCHQFRVAVNIYYFEPFRVLRQLAQVGVPCQHPGYVIYALWSRAFWPTVLSINCSFKHLPLSFSTSASVCDLQDYKCMPLTWLSCSPLLYCTLRKVAGLHLHPFFNRRCFSIRFPISQSSEVSLNPSVLYYRILTSGQELSMLANKLVLLMLAWLKPSFLH